MKSFPMRKFSRLHPEEEKPVLRYQVDPKKLKELEKTMSLSQALDYLTQQKPKQVALF